MKHTILWRKKEKKEKKKTKKNKRVWRKGRCQEWRWKTPLFNVKELGKKDEEDETTLIIMAKKISLIKVYLMKRYIYNKKEKKITNDIKEMDIIKINKK